MEKRGVGYITRDATGNILVDKDGNITCKLEGIKITYLIDIIYAHSYLITKFQSINI